MSQEVLADRIGDYIKAAIEILAENGNEITSSKLWTLVPKKLNLSPFELEKTSSGKIRWIVRLSTDTISLAKAGFIQKEGKKKKWFLTQKGRILIGKSSSEIYNLAKEYKNIYRRKGSINEGDPEEVIEEIHNLEGKENQLENFIRDYKNIRVKPDSITFSDLLSSVEKGITKLPEFQRDFVWGPKDIESLLSSILKGYPIGSFILWRTSRQLRSQKKISGVEVDDVPEGQQVTYVIDGQQRITSLYASVRGKDIRGEKYNFYFDLSTHKFGSEREKLENEPVDPNTKQMRVPLEKLLSRSMGEFNLFAGQFSETQRKILIELYDRFHRYSFAVIYIYDDDEYSNPTDNSIIKTITEIFTSINSTGSKLSQVSIIVAKCWGVGFDLRKNINEILDNTPGIDEDIIVQVAAAISNEKRISYPSIIGEIDKCIIEWQEKWDLIKEAFYKAIDFIKSSLRIRNLRLLPYDSLLIPLTYFYYIEPNPSPQQKEQVIKWFWQVGLSVAYSNNPYFRIQNDCNKMDQLAKNEKVEFNYNIDWDNFTSDLIKQQSLNNAFAKTVLCLYSYLGPKHFKDNSDVDLAKTYSETNKSNLHHFFPKSYLNKSKNPLKENQNSIVNIAFITSALNNELSNQAPSVYIKKMLQMNHNLEETLKSHLILDLKSFGIWDDDFERFLTRRAEVIENEFRKILGLPIKTKFEEEQKFRGPLDILEVRLREFISGILNKNYGDNYWQEVIPLDIQGAVKNKIESKIKKRPYVQEEYENPRSKFGLLDIGDYFKIIDSNWSLFKDIFKSQEILKRYFLDLKDYRNPIKHNNSLDSISQRQGEIAIDWFNQVLDDIEDFTLK